MGGADDKIEEGVFFHVGGKFSGQMGLQAQLDAHAEADPAFIFFFQGQELLPVGLKVQIEKAFGKIRRILIGPVHVEMLRKAESAKAL